MPLHVARHLGWLLRHRSHNGSTASRTAHAPRPATIQISTSPPPAGRISPPVEVPQKRT